MVKFITLMKNFPFISGFFGDCPFGYAPKFLVQTSPPGPLVLPDPLGVLDGWPTKKVVLGFWGHGLNHMEVGEITPMYSISE